MSTFSHTDYNSSAYNLYRPRYGRDLYDKVYSFHKSHNGQFDTALDVATGTGQVSSELSNSFKQVYAIDVSSTMLQNAVKRSNITYSVSTAEDLSQFHSNSIDLITTAQAAHWFNLNEFYKESFRVLKPHGTLAIWGYGEFFLKDHPNTEQCTKDLLAKYDPYWDEGVKALINLYRDFKLPKRMFQNVQWETEKDEISFLEAEWTIHRLEKYIRTYSCHKNYLAANPNSPDPVDEYIVDLRRLIGCEDHQVLRIGWLSSLILAEKMSESHDLN